MTTKQSKAEMAMVEELSRIFDHPTMTEALLDRATDLIMQISGVVEDPNDPDNLHTVNYFNPQLDAPEA